MNIIYSLSRRTLLLAVRTIIGFLRLFSPTVDSLFKRLEQSPGIPVSNPSASYWQTPPSPISGHGSDGTAQLPEMADIVVIGSGMTGTAFARTIMKNNKELKVVMLEARGACSGATGRNGGHIAPVLYAQYSELKEEHGIKVAKEIIRFRLAHLPEILKVAAEENLTDESQCREVQVIDVFRDEGLYREAKAMLAQYQKDLPSEGSLFQVHEGSEAIRRFELDGETVGCLSTHGGTLHPYRFVTGILECLLKVYPEKFYLFTHTPCTAIKTSPGGAYEVVTPRGTIKTKHVVHATNAWASHLLPGMRERIVPFRGMVNAQIPSAKPEWASTRSFVFYPGDTLFRFDYLMQQPTTLAGKKYPSPSGELMLGGGALRNKSCVEDIGNADDCSWNLDTGRYLDGVLDGYFGQSARMHAEVKAAWSGILGVSTDGIPWVGRVPEWISGRESGSAGRGEWIAAGYTGEGMAHSWFCGRAVAEMIGGFGTGASGVPEAMSISRERWAGTGVREALIQHVF